MSQITLHPRVTPDAVALVRRLEGLRLRALALPEGGFVIGHGHVSATDPGRAITAPEAHALLLFDLSRVAGQIEPLVLAPVTPAQFDALLSFAFGVGAQAFARSTVLKRLNAGAYLDAAAALELWRCARIADQAQVVDVLVRRRAIEKARFLEPPEGFAPAPSALLRAEEDATLLALAEALGDRRRISRLGAAEGEGEGEPAPSAALAVVAALSARLDRLLPTEPPPPPGEPEPEPGPVPEPEPEPPPVVVEAAVRPPVPAAFEPPVAPANVAAAEPGVAAAPPVEPRSAAEQPAAEALRLARPDGIEGAKAPRVSPPSMRGPAFVLGALGLLLFAWAVFQTYKAPSLPWLALGLAAVAAMAPASLHLIGPRRPSDRAE